MAQSSLPQVLGCPPDVPARTSCLACLLTTRRHAAMFSNMELHYGRISGNSSRAVFGLLEAGVPWEARILDVKGGENRSAEYLALNPMGKIPTLTDGGFRLWESNAINWYVSETHPEARLLPSSAQGRAAVQRWLCFQMSHVTPACVPVFMATNERIRTYWGVPSDEKRAEAGRKELARFLPVLDSALSEREYLEGVFSLADIAYVPHFVVLAEGGFDFSPYPHLLAWFERVCARPAWKETYSLVYGEKRKA